MSSIKRASYLFLANLIFLAHFILLLTVSFGWLSNNLFYPFLVTILATVISELTLGYCILSKWEFDLRRKVNPALVFDSSYIAHYGRALFGLKPRVKDANPKTFLQKNLFMFLLVILLIIGLCFHFLIIN